MGSIAALSTSRRTGPEVLSTSVEGGTRSFSVAIGIAPKDKHAPTLVNPAKSTVPRAEELLSGHWRESSVLLIGRHPETREVSDSDRDRSVSPKPDPH
jgi:hypothetical protein